MILHKRNPLKSEDFRGFGAASQIRTGDLILTKDALYLLSYSSVCIDSFHIISVQNALVNYFFRNCDKFFRSSFRGNGFLKKTVDLTHQQGIGLLCAAAEQEIRVAVAAFFGPEKAVDGAVLNTIHVRNDGGPVQRGDPVVHSVDEKQGPGILRAVNGLLPQRPAPEAQELIQIEEGIVQEGEAAEIVVNAGDRRFHGAVDAPHADRRGRMALRKNTAYGVAAHAVTEEEKMPASKEIMLSDKMQRGPQIV